MRDGEVRVFAGLKFGAINDIVALKRKEMKGNTRKGPEEYVEYGKKLSGKVDVLLLHGSPYMDVEEYRGRIA